ESFERWRQPGQERVTSASPPVLSFLPPGYRACRGQVANLGRAIPFSVDDVQRRVWTSPPRGAAQTIPSAWDPMARVGETQCERAHKGSIDANAGLQVICNPASSLERATGIEPATSSLGSWHSAAELRPRLSRSLVSRPALCQWSASPQSLGSRELG